MSECTGSRLRVYGEGKVGLAFIKASAPNNRPGWEMPRECELVSLWRAFQTERSLQHLHNTLFHCPEDFGIVMQGLVNFTYPVCKVTKELRTREPNRRGATNIPRGVILI